MRELTFEEKSLLRDLDDKFNLESVALGLNPYTERYVKKKPYSQRKYSEYLKLQYINKVKGLFEKFGIESVLVYWNGAHSHAKYPEVDLYIKNLIPCEGANGQCTFDCPKYKECVKCGNQEDF